jgi:hypothetical protein
VQLRAVEQIKISKINVYMHSGTFFNAEADSHLSPLRRQVIQHREELYEKVKKMRNYSYGERRYPKRRYIAEQKYPGDTDADFVKKYNWNVENGMWVHTKVEWLVPYEEVEYEYEWKKKKDMTEKELANLWPHEQHLTEHKVRKLTGWHKNWQDYAGASLPENPLLAITFTPAKDSHWPVAIYRMDDEPYHCSLAKYWELGPDIYDPGDIMEHLIFRFHNKTMKIKFDPTHKGDEYLDRDAKPPVVKKEGLSTTFSLHPTKDAIATDPWAREAKSRGYMKDRPWHISL